MEGWTVWLSDACGYLTPDLVTTGFGDLVERVDLVT